MTDRLTDDEIKALRVQVLGYHSLRDVLRALDEIEERRREDEDDAARLFRIMAKVGKAVSDMDRDISLQLKRKDGGA